MSSTPSSSSSACACSQVSSDASASWPARTAGSARSPASARWTGRFPGSSSGRWWKAPSAPRDACGGPGLKDIIFKTMATQPLILGSELARHLFRAGRSESLASRVVAEMRDSLFEGQLEPGDVLGTEKDSAARCGVSRIVARDALRTLEALGIAQLKMGKGGGARIAAGNPSLFAEALAVQLYLTGVGAAEVMDAQRAAECMAAELAAEHATGAEHARLEELLADAAAKTADTAAFTRSCRDFHMAIAEASHN